MCGTVFLCVGCDSIISLSSVPFMIIIVVCIVWLMIVVADQNHDNKGTQDEGDCFFFVDFLHVKWPLAIIRYDLVGLEPVCKGLMYTTAAASGLLEGHCCLS